MASRRVRTPGAATTATRSPGYTLRSPPRASRVRPTATPLDTPISPLARAALARAATAQPPRADCRASKVTTAALNASDPYVCAIRDELHAIRYAGQRHGADGDLRRTRDVRGSLPYSPRQVRHETAWADDGMSEVEAGRVELEPAYRTMGGVHRKPLNRHLNHTLNHTLNRTHPSTRPLARPSVLHDPEGVGGVGGGGGAELNRSELNRTELNRTELNGVICSDGWAEGGGWEQLAETRRGMLEGNSPTPTPLFSHMPHPLFFPYDPNSSFFYSRDASRCYTPA